LLACTSHYPTVVCTRWSKYHIYQRVHCKLVLHCGQPRNLSHVPVLSQTLEASALGLHRRRHLLHLFPWLLRTLMHMPPSPRRSSHSSLPPPLVRTSVSFKLVVQNPGGYNGGMIVFPAASQAICGRLQMKTHSSS
jgi:hypothetical protein